MLIHLCAVPPPTPPDIYLPEMVRLAKQANAREDLLKL